MGIFGKKRPAVLDYTSAVNPPPNLMRDPMASLGGYDRNAAMQGQSGFAPMNVGFAPPEQKKPGFFSKGGAWLDVLGAFGDAFGTNGPVYAQQKAQRSRLMQEAQMAEQKRMQDREDFLFQEGYKRANPMPANNDTINDVNWYLKASPEERDAYHKLHPVITYMADGTPRQIDPRQLAAPSGGPKPGTIEDGHEFLGGDPSDPKSWRPVAGGGVRNGTSGF